MIHWHLDGLVSHVTQFQKDIGPQLPLYRDLPSARVGIARIRIVERDVLSKGSSQTERGSSGLLETVRKRIGQRGGWGEVAIQGRDKLRCLTEPRRVSCQQADVSDDAIREIEHADPAADDGLTQESRSPGESN